MHEVNLLIIFNHRHESVVDRVIDYNRRFTSQISIAAPFAAPGVIQYSSGCTLAQGAIVEYLHERAPDAGYTVVIHDDLVLNPRTDLHDLLPESGEWVRLYRTRLMEGRMTPTWFWQFRVLAAWFTPKTSPFGTHVNDPAGLLRSSALYAANEGLIRGMGTSRLSIEGDPQAISPVLAAWVDAHMSGRTTFDLGLPLFMGNADYLVFPNRWAPLIEDFLRRTIECGLMSEVAVPTLAAWLGLPMHFDADRQILRTGERAFTELTSVDAIERYFEQHPDLLSIHPVKFSRFPSAAD